MIVYYTGVPSGGIVGGWGGSDGGGPEALACTLGSRSGGNLWDRKYDMLIKCPVTREMGFVFCIPVGYHWHSSQLYEKPFILVQSSEVRYYHDWLSPSGFM